MNKKKINYILIPLVLLIWGGIIYTAINGLSTSNDEYVLNQSLPEVKMDAIKNDTFVLLANYRDPFLRRTYTNKTSSQNKKILPKKKEQVTPLPTVNWNFITYHGKIQNQKTSKNVAIINVSGKDYLVNEGETVEEVKLVKLFEDSIKILYHKKYVFIKKN